MKNFREQVVWNAIFEIYLLVIFQLTNLGLS